VTTGGADPIAWVLIAAWVFWVGVDQRAWGGFLIHQPLVAGTVAGVLCGMPKAGFLVGAGLQALWPGPLPMGGALQPAGGLAACATIVWTRLCLTGGASRGGWGAGEMAAAGAAALLMLSSAGLGTRLEQGLRRWNRRLARRGGGRGAALAAIALAGLAGVAAVAALVAVFAGAWRLAAFDDGPSADAAVVLAWALLGIGLGGEILRSSRRAPVHPAWLFAGALVGGLVGLAGR